MNKYFKRAWEESRGGEFEDWGHSVWYFETDEKGHALRQIEAYDNGNILRYDEEDHEDDYGFLADEILDMEEFAPFEISKDDFEKMWEGEEETEEEE